MKPIRNLLDKLHPHFAQGGRFERWHALYESLDTFLYTPGEVTKSNTHVRDGLDLKRMMTIVVVALAPCIVMALWNTGYQANLAIEAGNGTPFDDWRGALMGTLGVGHDPGNLFHNLVFGALYFFPVYFVTIVAGGLWEVLFAIVRKHEVNEGFLVTSILFPLTLPPTIPLWQVAVGISFGVVIGKEIFGGTGRNFLNPALTARAFLYFAYPAQISGPKVWTGADGFTGATPLGVLADGPVSGGLEQVGVTWGDAFIGTMQGSMGETSALACLLGAILLIATRIGCWRIITGVFLGAIGLATLLWGIGSETNALFLLGPHWHLVIGGLAFGAVFMATDPVSAAMTETGKWIYGILIGALTVLIRVINPAFPEGIMLAILFGNVMAPLIDYFVVQANIKRRMARHAA